MEVQDFGRILIFHNFKSTGFPFEIPKLSLVCKAARIRTFVKSLNGVDEHLDWIRAEAAELDAVLVHPFGQWMSEGAAATIERTFKKFKVQSFVEFSYDGDWTKADEDMHFQRSVYRFPLASEVKFDIRAYIRYILSRWFTGVELEDCADQALRNIEILSKRVPPCVLFCLASAWCNGWATGKRFQQRNSKCRIWHTCIGEDSLEHYSVCDYAIHAFESKLGLVAEPWGIKRSLILHSDSPQSIIIQSCHLYAAKRAADLGRREKHLEDLSCLRNFSGMGIKLL